METCPFMMTLVVGPRGEERWMRAREGLKWFVYYDVWSKKVRGENG